MDSFRPRYGTFAPYWQHMQYIAQSMDGAIRAVLSDYISVSPDFFIDGCLVTSTPSGTSTNHSITAGHLVFKGEVMPVDAHSITQLSTQVVFIDVQDDGVDVTPVPNQDGQYDMVMRRRHAVLRVASVYPAVYMSLGAPRKDHLDRLRFGGYLVPRGSVLPYYGPLSDFNSSGLGINGTRMQGWAICNGANGTPDLRGMVPMGATDVPAVGAPSPYSGLATNTSMGDAVGLERIILDADQLPAHTHAINPPQASYWSASGGGANVSGAGTGDGTGTFPTATEPNTTAGNPIDIRQPSLALTFIMSLM